MTDWYSLDEWFCARLAQTIHDAEMVFHGFASPCATIAMHLAKRTHAPHMVLIEGATYAVNPDPWFIPPTSNDRALMHDASYVMSFEELFDAGARGDLDRMFLSGAQIDRLGNTNVTLIGTRDAIGVKLGGGGGGCNLSATVGALTLWTTRHRSARTLVDRCDFVTDLGHRTPDGTRAELGHRGGGPEMLVTELGVFKFCDGVAVLVERFPDVEPAEIERATGFAFGTADVPLVPPPPAEVIELVRALDPLGVRQREFAPRELARMFELR